MNDARIERLTREALGPGKRATYTPLDDAVLRAVGIVVLIVTVIAFASWPRGDAAGEPRSADARPQTHASVVPASHRAPDNKRDAMRAAEYTPLY